jgi:hypothetical protein
MFLKAKLNPFYTFGKGQYLSFLNVDNLKSISRRKLKSYQKRFGSDLGWEKHKSYVLWKWINQNFTIKESFIVHLEKYIKKLEIKISRREENLIFTLKGLYFATWRPMKEIIVRFELDKKETIYFFESDGKLYSLPAEDEKSYKPIETGDFYFSNKKLYICDEHQNIKLTMNYDDIQDVQFHELGTIVETKRKRILIRSQNKYMTFVVLQRLMPKLKLDINKVKNLYDYFDFWNKVMARFN